jgi:hypothetical protein
MSREIQARIVLLIAVIFLGLASRHFRFGFALWDKDFGDSAYAAAVFLVLTIVFPRRHPIVPAIAAMALCTAVEFFKLTGIPAQWAWSPISRILFGTTFSWGNLICYAVGIAAARLTIPGSGSGVVCKS